MFSPGRKAFSIVELLIVLGIMAVLTALLFPAFGAAREKARQGACINNIKSIGMALKMYSGDNNRGLPPVSSLYAGVSRTWAYSLKNGGGYIDTYSAFYCPGDVRNVARGSSAGNILESISYNYVPAAQISDSLPLSGTDPGEGSGGYYAGMELPFCGQYGPSESDSLDPGAPKNGFNAGGQHGGIYLVLYGDGNGARYRNRGIEQPEKIGDW